MADSAGTKRRLDLLLGRTRPDPVSSPYRRKPADMPLSGGGGEPGFWARLKTESSAGVYTARRLLMDGATDADAEALDLTNVIEVNGISGIPALEEYGTVVWARPSGDEYRFACPIFPPESGETSQVLIFDSDDGDMKWVDLEEFECP